LGFSWEHKKGKKQCGRESKTANVSEGKGVLNRQRRAWRTKEKKEKL